MENAYIYTRVSTIIQVDGFSLDAQEEEIRAYAKMRNINIVGKYSDEGKSGKNAEHRPAFNQMLKDIRSKKDNVRYVLVFKLSRFARNTSDTAKYLQELASFGVGLLGVKDGIDTSTATGKMIANIMGAVAEMELENIHEQTLAGRQQKARSGLWNGAQAPFGYSLVDKMLVICPEEAEIVKEIFRLYTEEGQSIQYITKKLNDENVRREQRGNTMFSTFTTRAIRSILQNPVYAGKIVYGRRHTIKVEGTNNETKVVKQNDESKIILADGVHEAIISQETFSKAEERLNENAAHRKTRSDSTTVYPLTGLIKCPDCGKNIFGYTAPPRPRKNGKEGFYPRYISYRCISGRERNGITCSLANKYYSGTRLEKEVKEVVSAMVTIPEFVKLVSAKIDWKTDIKALRNRQGAVNGELIKYNGNLLQTEKRLAELDADDKHYEKKVESLNRILDELYEKIDDAQARLKAVNDEIALVEKSAMTKESIFEMLEGFSKFYDTMTPEDKKALLQAMISSIEIYKDKREDGHLIKTLHFTFPVTYDGESGALFVRSNEQHVDTIPHLFWYNAFVMLSNGVEAKIGTLGSKWAFFHEWKRLNEGETGSVALEIMLRGICKKENFLDLFENFILYDHTDGRTVKILARNHQYLGVNEAVKAYEARKLNDGKLGVFWHTQGSGKSYSMVFLAQKIRRKFTGSPTIVVLTDRDELNKQISDTFENCGLLGKTKASQYIASSGDDLIQKLKGNPSFIFTLIQKFNHSAPEPIYPDHDIIIMSDEAHRSQYGTFAGNMMSLLPTAARIGFTGTPLLSSDNLTARTFGGYISVYDFKRAVEDGATVPLYYENRGEKLEELHNPEITDRILDAIEAADLDVDQQDKLEREFAKEIHLMMAEPRQRSIARDFAGHYSDLWTSGKAMFVCLNKVSCVRMYDYVQEYWQAEIRALKAKIHTATQQEAQELERKLRWMEETEMAVVISQEQNEIQTFNKWELNIKPHREKMEKRELDKEFKDPDNPLRVVFVCAMWLTGFDVKCLSCLYLDKPLKAHTLMQTIARANRVNEGKSNGLIVDYIGIVKALQKALTDYTTDGGPISTEPTVDKAALLARIRETLASAEAFLASRDFPLQALIDADSFAKIALLQDAANAVCGTLEDKKRFTTHASELNRLMKYTDRNDITGAERKQYDAIAAIYGELQKKRRHVSNVDLMVQINDIINEYVQIKAPEAGLTPSQRYDISAINFELLQREFAKSKRKHLVMKDLEDMIQQRLAQMLFTNPDRINYYERYQEIIEAYNSEQNRADIEKTFMDLMALANSMDQEQQRYVREGFTSDEELSLYDLLFKDDLTKADIKKIKEVAVDLLRKIKEKIAELDHWTDKQETKAEVDNLIRNTLWDELPECYDEISISAYRQRIYEYVYMRYKEIA